VFASPALLFVAGSRGISAAVEIGNLQWIVIAVDVARSLKAICLRRLKTRHRSKKVLFGRLALCGDRESE
jgi:hypothetical protein